ncbi:MAG TPA: hypothetical protein VGD43_07005, partial [Micromonospora sp.]
DPVLVAADATDLRSRAEDGRVVLTWQLPEHATRVEVRRSAVDSADTVLLPDVEPARVVATRVDNGVRYRYTVRVAYRDPSGRLWWSAGVDHTVTPVERPAPPGPLTVTAVPSKTGLFLHRTQVRWPAAEFGRIRVVRQPGAGSLREGERVGADTVDRNGHVLRETSPADDIWIEPHLEVCSYFPVLVIDDVGYVGRARRYAKAADPVDPQGEFVGSVVRLGWTWSGDATAALVGYDASTSPVDPTTASGQLVVARADGDRFGGCDLPVGGDGAHVVVAGVVRRHGVDFVTSGVGLSVQRAPHRVRYEVRAPSRRRRELVLFPGQPLTLPALVLVGRPDRPPRTRDDGEPVARIEPMPIAGRHPVRLPRADATELRYRLFTASAAESGTVELDGSGPVTP